MRLEINMKHIKSTKKVVKTKLSAPTNKFLNAMFRETSKGETENGAITYERSGSQLLDFYAQAGAMRKNPDKALDLFKKALAEDKLKAIKILFYLRDIRGGQGERDLFRNCLQWLGEQYTEIFEKIVNYVAEFGRWDDLFFDNKVCYDIINAQLNKDKESENPTLLTKWMPTINASSDTTKAKARLMAKALGYTEKEYRKTIRNIRKQIATVEEKMSAQEWSKIDYSAVPSQAARIYKNAFKKHDETRYDKFIEKAEKGEVKINAATLYPYQIYKGVQSDYSKTLEALWKQLPDYTMNKNTLVVADTSGSMQGDPMSVSVSLALYFAERNKGQFQNYFISFTEKPKLHKIVGTNLRERMDSIELGDVANTDLQAVFDLILNTATKNNTPEEEMPETIYIISDMEFDSCCQNHTNYEEMQNKYTEAGYKIPNIVFWNVDARSGKNMPVQTGEKGVALVSGLSPIIFKMAIENKTPEQVMEDTINSERYNIIKIE